MVVLARSDGCWESNTSRIHGLAISTQKQNSAYLEDIVDVDASGDLEDEHRRQAVLP